MAPRLLPAKQLTHVPRTQELHLQELQKMAAELTSAKQQLAMHGL